MNDLIEITIASHVDHFAYCTCESCYWNDITTVSTLSNGVQTVD